MDQYEAIKEWYDGYTFGDLEVYCPWDVINYCGDPAFPHIDIPDTDGLSQI